MQAFEELLNSFLKWLHHFTLLVAMGKSIFTIVPLLFAKHCGVLLVRVVTNEFIVIISSL